MRINSTLIKSLCFTGGLSLWASCASDEGNYDYQELNSLSISGVEEKYEVEQFSTLEITPTLTGSKSFNADDYEYLWYVYLYNDFTGNMPDTLSHEMTLKAEIAKSPSSEYCLVFQVKEKSTGLTTLTRSDLTVVNTYSKGLAILSDVEGMAEVSFINSLDKVTVNAFEAVNGRPLGHGPIGIFHGGRNANCRQQLFISTEDSCVVTNTVDFSYEMNFNDLFYFPSKPGRLEALSQTNTGMYEHCIVDGKVFKRRSFVWDDDPDLPLFSTYLPCDGGGKVAPFSFYNDNIGGYFYDMNKKRFVYDDFTLLAPLSEGYGNEHFDPLNLNMDLMWGTNVFTKDGLSNIRMVMRDTEGKVYILYGLKQDDFDLETYDSWTYIVPLGKMRLSDEASNATCYDMSSVDANFLYYATGNTIVGISILTGNILSKITLDGGKVDHMEFDPNDQSRMYVGVSNGSGKANSGTVYYLKMTTNGQLSIEKKFEGICGKTVDFQVNYSNAD